jgi:hypothetical protein
MAAATGAFSPPITELAIEGVQRTAAWQKVLIGVNVKLSAMEMTAVRVATQKANSEIVRAEKKFEAKARSCEELCK